MKEYVGLDCYKGYYDIAVRATVQIGEYKGKFEAQFDTYDCFGAEVLMQSLFSVADKIGNWTPLGEANIENDGELFVITLANKKGELKTFTITYLSDLNPHVVGLKIVKNEFCDYLFEE